MFKILYLPRFTGFCNSYFVFCVPMLIAIDIREAARGEKAGKGWYTFQLVQEMLNQDTKNQYLLYTDRPFPKWSKFQNATQKFFPPRSILWHYNAMKDIKKMQPDIFFAPTSYIIAAFAPPELKTVITVHDLIAWLARARHNQKATLIEHYTLPTALKKAHHVVTVSASTKNDLRKLFAVEEKKISIIPCAAGDAFHKIEESEKEKFRLEKNLPKKFILSIGTLEPRKNHITTLKSFSRIRKKFPDIDLIIIGGKGWYWREIFKTVETLKLQEAVQFPDYIAEEDLAKYYACAEMLVYPSLYEGFGLPPLEAMKSGCPVITSNLSSLPEITGNAALLIDPKSVDELTENIEKILEDQKLRESIIEKGFEQATKFSWRQSAARTIELFSSIHS